MSSASIIPNDLIFLILCSLPPKSLLRFVTVFRSWNQDIKSPIFISHHLNKTLSITNNDHESQLLLLHSSDSTEGICSLYMDKEKDKALNECKRFNFPFWTPFCTFSYRVVGSCNGVLCLYAKRLYDDDILLWNPSIHKYLRIPQPQTRSVRRIPNNELNFPYDEVDFGFDSTTGDFKVLKLRTVRVNVMEAEVYSLIGGSWRIIARANALKCDLRRNRNIHVTCCVNDSLHWIAYHGEDHTHPCPSLILAFNLRSEVFREFSLPHCHNARGYSWSIHEHGESSIAAFERSSSEGVTDIWVMKQYGVENSWAKLWSFNQRKMEVLKTLRFRKNGDLLMKLASGDIMSLDLNVQQGENVTKCTPGLYQISVHKYVQSLILFDKGEDEPAYPTTDGEKHGRAFGLSRFP